MGTMKAKSYRMNANSHPVCNFRGLVIGLLGRDILELAKTPCVTGRAAKLDLCGLETTEFTRAAKGFSLRLVSSSY